MNFPKKLIFFLSCIFILPINLHAEVFSGSPGGTGRKLLYISGALKAGYGTTSTVNTTTVPSTKMAAYSAEGTLGFRLFGFILGANGEYSLWKQLTDPSKVSNVNSQGKLTAFYPLLGLEFGPFRLIGKFPSLFSGAYTLDKANSSGEIVKYKSADALSAQLHWNTTSMTFWGIEYQSLKFKKVDTAGTESSLTDAQKLKMNSFGILYGFFF